MLVLASCGRLSFDAREDAGNNLTDSQLGDAGGSAVCNSITRLADDFSIDRSAQLWTGSYADSTASSKIAGGTATLTLAVNAASAYVGIVSGRYYDLHGQRVFVGLQHPANAKTTTGLGINVAPKTLAHVEVQDGIVIAVREIAGAYFQGATAPYDPVAMRYLALSERNGRLYWETSRDGVAFDVLYDEPAPFDLTLVNATVFAGSATALAAPGSAVFDHFDGGTPSSVGACKAATLVDPFDNGMIGPLWANSFTDACCSDTESNGQVVLASDGTAGFAGRRSSAGYDLRESTIVLATKGPQQPTNLYGALVAVIDKKNYLTLEIRDGGGYECNAFVSGVLHQTPAAIVTGDAYIRMRESGGMLVYEASSDATTWRQLATIPDPLDLSDLLIGIEIGSNTASVANAVAFDGFNAP
jgi:hypothetical protein